ncbi:MAG: hypothetical protein ACOY4R_10130 [Pseudomonadota bacterium]
METDVALRRLAMLAMLFVATANAAGCSIPAREPAVPVADTTRARPLGIPNARSFADAGPQAMVEEAKRARERERAALRASGQLGTWPPPANYLAVSSRGVRLLRLWCARRG